MQTEKMLEEKCDPPIMLDGRYKILREIGQGSEGRVYLVFQESTFRFLAAKEVRKDGKVYCREGIEVWKRLKHPHLPEILDLIETEDTVWIIMEYMEGLSLPGWIRNNGIPGYWRFFIWLWIICKTLQYLHSQKPPVIFGDLKSDNIMIQKEEPILVDFGSAYIQGSKTRKSGTRHRDSELHGINREIKGDIICLGYTLEEISANLPKELCIFAKKAKETREDSFWKIGDCLKYLKKLFVRRCLQVLVCLLAGILLVLCSKSCVAEFRSRSKDGEYERDFRLCEEATSQKKELLLELINRYPEKWEGYLEFLDTLLEDRMLTAEEYLSFLEIYNNWEEKLLLDLNGYAEVVYQTGLCCWYFYQGRENTRLAMEWFRKLQGYPEELKKKSDVYLALGEFRDKADLFQKTGEHHGEYLDYFEQCETLKGSEEVYFQLMFYKEEILFLVHYMAELRMEGLTRERMRVFLDEMKKELEFISDQRSNIVELKQEVEGVMRILEETTRQIYEE